MLKSFFRGATKRQGQLHVVTIIKVNKGENHTCADSMVVLALTFSTGFWTIFAVGRSLRTVKPMPIQRQMVDRTAGRAFLHHRKKYDATEGEGEGVSGLVVGDDLDSLTMLHRLDDDDCGYARNETRNHREGREVGGTNYAVRFQNI
jgi:hypothetical protein